MDETIALTGPVLALRIELNVLGGLTDNESPASLRSTETAATRERQSQGGIEPMADLISDFMDQLGPDVSRQLSANLGLSPQAATQIIPQVIPMIMGGAQAADGDPGRGRPP